MTTLTETTHPFEFVISHANGTLSYDTGTLASGNDLAAGTVLGIVTSSGEWSVFDQDAANGTQNAAGILCAATDAGSAAADCVVLNHGAEVNGALLVWPGDIDPAEQAAAEVQLKALDIKIR